MEATAKSLRFLGEGREYTIPFFKGIMCGERVIGKS
jgi:hypothetical protein